MILHLLVIRSKNVRSIVAQTNVDVSGNTGQRVILDCSSAFLFPNALWCRSRGNANEEVIVRNASRSKLGRLLFPRCDFTMYARPPHVH